VLVGIAGADSAGADLAMLIESFGGSVVDAIVRTAEARTTRKTRYVAGDRHLLRADRDASALTPAAESMLIEAVNKHADGCDAIVVSDYAKGVVSPATMRATRSVADKYAIPLIADPKRRDFALYSGADLLTPNHKELAFATGEPCDDLASCAVAAARVMTLTGAAVLLTRSEAGVALYRPREEPWAEDARAKVVRDVSGAGDTVLAVCATALAAGADMVEASHLANVAAAVAVGKSGTSCVTADELNLALLHAPDSDTLAGKLVSAATARLAREVWKGQGLEVGFTNGCFDLLHPGHVELLREARTKCDRLVVALNTDASVRRLKGAERPIQTELARAEVIGALRSVDLVVLFDEDTPLALIADLRPDVLIKGADYTIETVVGSELVEEWNGRVALIDLIPGHSSSRLIERSRPTLPNAAGASDLNAAGRTDMKPPS
jgi:D-beta-D-heptose 7-phosphate kinase/D-beta-D-heptose 1-phosphate adenosyltransferase